MGSDHFACITVVNEESIIENNLSMQLWKLNKADWKNYKENSNLALTNEILVKTNINDKYSDILECITTLANQSIPCKNQNIRNKKKNKKFKPLPYWNNKCNEAIYKRNQYRNKMKKTKELNDYLEYKKQEAIVKKTLKTEAKFSWQDYCSKLTDQTKLGSVWNMARKMNGITAYASIPTLDNNNGLLAESNLDKANLLAHTYEKTSNSQNFNEKFLNHIKENNLENNPSRIEGNYNVELKIINEIFNLNELKQAIRSAKNNKSPGDDRIPYELLKHLHKNALRTLLSFYNELWSEGIVPSDWNHAIILPLLKPNKDATKPESYRPISLTATLCKVMEKMVANRLQWYLEKNNLITLNQSGFRKHKSTIDQILKLQDTILKKLKNKEQVLAIFIDFERAYDMLHVPTLLQKLQKLGIVGNVTNWIEKFLSKRTFQVKVGTELSEKLIQQNGTPQGSVISPLLFLIMINDIPSGPEGVNMSLFADDSAVYIGHRKTNTLIKKIQQSIEEINNWCNQNGFKISIAKTVGVLFTNKRYLPTIDIKIDNEIIKMENKAKFLGMIFDRKLSWKQHIEYIIEKCKKRLNLMRAVSGYQWGASKKSLLAIYKALIRSILDYGDVAYSSASKSLLNKLSTIQNEALRLCCGTPRGTAALTLQNECGEIPLHLRRLYNSNKMGLKILGNKVHPCKVTFQPHWTDILRTPQNKNHSIHYRTNDFLSHLDTSFIGPCFPQTPSWRYRKIDVDTSLKKHINKKTDNPEFLKLIALQMISRYKLETLIYTDGSKAEKIVTAAFTVPSLGIDRKFRLCNGSSIYAAEMTAIKEAVTWLINTEKNKNCQYVILSDSLSVLTSIKKNKSDSRPNLFNELMIQLNRLECDQVKMVWIPSHVDIKGNEKADELAKEALSLDNINSTNYLEIQEMYTLLKEYMVNKWQIEYNSENIGKFYKNICPTVSTNIKFSDPNRHKEVQINRLRLGVAITNKRLFQMRKHPTGLCDTCEVTESIEHLLLECKKENISTILKDQCNSYKSEFNLKSLLDIGCLQSAVYNLVKLINTGKIL
jgi:ribonuclease HI